MLLFTECPEEAFSETQRSEKGKMKDGGTVVYGDYV